VCRTYLRVIPWKERARTEQVTVIRISCHKLSAYNNNTEHGKHYKKHYFPTTPGKSDLTVSHISNVVYSIFA